MNGTEAAGETIHLAMFSLFPPTYKGRENGMRIDIAEVSGPGKGLGVTPLRLVVRHWLQ